MGSVKGLDLKSQAELYRAIILLYFFVGDLENNDG